MRSRDLEDIVENLAEACQGAAVVEPPCHLPAVRLRSTLAAVRKARLTLMALEARLQRALQIRQAG